MKKFVLIYLLIAFLMIFLPACAGSDENYGFCTACSSEEVFSSVCPCCNAEICESCFADAKHFYEKQYARGLDEGWEEGFYDGEIQGYCTIIDSMDEEYREIWLENNQEIVETYTFVFDRYCTDED